MKKLFSSIVFVCLVTLLAAPSESHAESFMAFGDSLTMGLWGQPHLGEGRRVGGYEPHLEYFFSVVGRSAQVYNWGVGGETTLQALQGGKVVCTIVNAVEVCAWKNSRTVDSALARQGSANYMLILEGTNDFFAGISPQSTAYNLGIMADKGRAYGMEPIIATLPPDERGTGKDLYAYNAAIFAVGQQKGIKIVDLHSGMIDNWGSYVGTDNLHPTEYGYKAMAAIWFGPFLNLQTTTSKVTYQMVGGKLQTNLNVTVTANGNLSGLAIQYGKAGSLGSTVTASPSSGNGYTGVSIGAHISGLEFETLYSYRVAANMGGSIFISATKTFTTPKRFATLPWLMLILR